LDKDYQIYLNQILRMTLPETYRAQVQNIQESPKFVRNAGQDWQPVPFPGYTVITPPGPEDDKNALLYAHLENYQRQIGKALGSDVFVPVPPGSFHLTLADVVWDSSFKLATESPGFETQLRQSIAHSFEQCPSTGEAIRFQVVGLMVMTRAITVALAAKGEEGYYNILNLRRSLYQNPELIRIGVEQQYNFISHITLGYFGDLSGADRGALCTQLETLNEPWIGTEQKDFWVHRAELRKFPDMATYQREPDWASYEF
jgi:hypothetical protein